MLLVPWMWAATEWAVARARANLPRIAAAALGMGATLVVLRVALGPALAGAAGMRIAALAALVAGGLAAFLGLAVLLGVSDLRDLRRRLRRQPA